MPEVKLISPVTRRAIDKKRVAAYCRVSSNSADQQNSYANQIKVYTSLIQKRKEWELVEIFADEGLSGMKAENRTEFQRMIQMCELHQIDLTELDHLILKDDVRSFGRIEKLGPSDFKTPHVKIAGFNGNMDLRLFFDEPFGVHDTVFRWLDAGGCTIIISSLETRPTRIDLDKSFKQSAVYDANLRQNRLVPILCVVQHVLNRYEVIPRYNGFMMIMVDALHPVAAILL